MLSAMLNFVLSAKPPMGNATTTILLPENDLQLIQVFLDFNILFLLDFGSHIKLPGAIPFLKPGCGRAGTTQSTLQL